MRSVPSEKETYYQCSSMLLKLAHMHKLPLNTKKITTQFKEEKRSKKCYRASRKLPRVTMDTLTFSKPKKGIKNTPSSQSSSAKPKRWKEEHCSLRYETQVNWLATERQTNR